MTEAPRVMALGDSHADITFAIQAIKLAASSGASIIHVVGDFGIWTHVDEGITYLNTIDQTAEQAGVLVTFTDGNHENFDHLYAIPIDDDGWRRVRPHIWHAPRGHIWRWGSVNFLSMGGAHSINGPGGAHWWTQGIGPLDKDLEHHGALIPKGTDLGDWWPEEVITDEEVQTAIQNMVDWVDHYPLWPNIDVMFAHDAPTSISLPHTSYPAAEQNRARLQQVYEVAQPQLLVHGHYHIFQQYHDRHLGCLAVCLAHNESKDNGQYTFIDTDPFKVTIPTWRRP